LDSILCSNKEEAHKVIDEFSGHVIDWEFLENDKVRIYVDSLKSD